MPITRSLTAVALVCICLRLASADPVAAPGPARTLDDLTRRLGTSVTALADQFRPFAKRLADAELAALRDLHVTAITPYQEDLLVRTVESIAPQSAPLPEEVEFRCLWMRMALERLVKDPITEADTALLRSQVPDLRARLSAAADQALPEQADTFRKRSLEPWSRALDQAAQSLAGGGPMHPLPAGEADRLVAEFSQKAAEPSRVRIDPGYPLSYALSAVSADLFRLSFGPNAEQLPPDVLKAMQAWMKAQRRWSDERARADVAKLDAQIVRENLTPEVESMVSCAVVADALALWHELRMLGAKPGPADANAAAISASVRVVFYGRDEAPQCMVDGPIVWSPEAREGSDASFADQNANDGPPVQWWNGMNVRLTASTSAFALRGPSGKEDAGCVALPPDVPPFTRLDDQALVGALAAEATVARSLWAAVLGLWRGGPDARVNLAATYSQGLSPLMWNSQPRAMSAVRHAHSITLQTVDGQAVALITGRDWVATGSGAAVGTGPAFPMTMEVVLSPRTVNAEQTSQVGTRDGVKTEVNAATIGLDARAVTIRMHVTKRGALALDEYRAVYDGDSPLCTVSFSGYSE